MGNWLNSTTLDARFCFVLSISLVHMHFLIFSRYLHARYLHCVILMRNIASVMSSSCEFMSWGAWQCLVLFNHPNSHLPSRSIADCSSTQICMADQRAVRCRGNGCQNVDDMSLFANLQKGPLMVAALLAKGQTWSIVPRSGRGDYRKRSGQ